MANSTTVELLRRLQRLERQVEHQHTKPPRDTAMLSGGRLLGTLVSETRYGGGRLQWTFNGQGPVNWGAGATAWTETNIDASNYASVTPTDALKQAGGGPYVTLNGSDECLSIPDAAWQEPVAEEFLVWAWAYTTSLAADFYVVSKWDVGSNLRCYRIFYDQAAGVFKFSVSSDGAIGTVVSATSTYAEVINKWYFLAGYYQASTTMNIYVGAAMDGELTAVANTTSIPATTFDGGAATAIGCGYNSGSAAYFLPGGVGTAAMWLNVPAANIGTYAQHLFAQSRWAYGGKG